MTDYEKAVDAVVSIKSQVDKLKLPALACNVGTIPNAITANLEIIEQYLTNNPPKENVRVEIPPKQVREALSGQVSENSSPVKYGDAMKRKGAGG
jgi:hypothetical protein